MPDLFQALRTLVPFPQASFVCYNDRLQGLDGFSDWSFPNAEDVQALLVSEYYQKDRMQELFLSGREIAKLPLISRSEQWLRVGWHEYLAHEFYRCITQPSQMHHHLHLRLMNKDGIIGILTINRPSSEAGFSKSEEDTLWRLIPFLTRAMEQPVSEWRNNWVDVEQGLIVFESAKVLYADGLAPKLLDYALERRQQTGRGWYIPPLNPLLQQILKTLAEKLPARIDDDADAEPAIVRRCNRWGRFEFRARWLEAAAVGKSGIYAATIHRLAPLPLCFSIGLKNQPLSLRESQVALALALGDSHAKIADKLNISERTVIGHSQHIYNKLKVANRVELVATLISG